MTSNQTNKRRWASLSEAAAYVGVNQRTIRRMITSGKITGYQASKALIRVDLDEIDAVFVPMQSAANI